MRMATISIALGGMLLLLLPAGRSEAGIIFDFTGICSSGDCDAGSTVAGALEFSDDAELFHRNRSVSADDFVSLALEFTTVGRARAMAEWSPGSKSGTTQPLEVLIDTAGELEALLLRDDLVNAFQLDDAGAWSYRQIQTTPEGQLTLDLTLIGNEGLFARRRAAVSEPTTLALVTFFFGLALLRTRV